ncbi:MAG: hypothetical protein FWB85_06380 [Chitinispirillia bacterium]|nr:hypothetical protein [Chitinispirillia bacterium]MCL2241836.1 hypothetical protein [Chitinispirillia bacterium]
MRLLSKIALPAMFLAVCFCSESDEIIRQKFDIIIADDMKAILEGVAEEALLEKPYVDILEYVKYEEGVFTRRAVVDFYFLKTIGVKISRKYRYHKRLGLWDRYYNKYYQFEAETAGAADVAEN